MLRMRLTDIWFAEIISEINLKVLREFFLIGRIFRGIFISQEIASCEIKASGMNFQKIKINEKIEYRL